jgi:FeS assembly SUF system regulator
MIRLSKLSDYAVVVLEALARDPSRVVSAGDISAETKIPEPTVSKVLKAMSGVALVTSSRGVSGGYQLAKPAATISVQEIVTAIEGPVALTACVEENDQPCALELHCALSGRWDTVNKAIAQTLSSISLAQMMRKV